MMIDDAVVAIDSSSMVDSPCNDNHLISDENRGDFTLHSSSENSGIKIPIPSSFASSSNDSSVSIDGSARKSSLVHDIVKESFHAPKRAKPSLTSSGNAMESEEEVHHLKNTECDTVSSLPMKPSTVEDRVRARALLQLQSEGAPHTSGTNGLRHSSSHTGSDPDLVLRIADGIWSHSTSLRKQRIFNSSTKTVSNYAPKFNENSLESNYQTFSLQDLIQVLRTTNMTHVSSTGAVMNVDAGKSKLSKREVLQALFELATPERYSNWISMAQSPHKSELEGNREEAQRPTRLEDVSPNTMVRINHAVQYTTVRKQILKSTV